MVRILFLVASLFSSLTIAAGSFPQGPDSEMTPGSFCERADSHRYPERVPYCTRNVSRDEKWEIIEAYNEKGGYDINSGNRQQFKIDHLIPLCAGGSNESSNLWPQHKSLYVQTDPLEPLICDKMKAGVLKQARAADLIIRAKKDLSLVRAIRAELEAL